MASSKSAGSIRAYKKTHIGRNPGPALSRRAALSLGPTQLGGSLALPVWLRAHNSILLLLMVPAAAVVLGLIRGGGAAERQSVEIPPWAGTQISEWDNAGKAILLPDMTAVEPSSALAPKMKKRHWKRIPYELIGGQKGNMIWAGPESNAPRVSLPLGVKGWHAIFVGDR